MVEYTCNLCNKTFDHKSTYVRHCNKKKPCIIGTQTVLPEQLGTQLIPETDENECLYCNKTFTSLKSLRRHNKHYCAKNKINNNIEKELNILKEKINELENVNKQLIKNTITNNNNSNNNTNNNTNNGTINNITINQYGKEDMSHITLQDFKGLFSRCNSCVPFFVELLHFNKDKPENNNIYISNMKSPYLMLYDGAKWKLAEKNAILDDMYDDKCEILVNKYEDLKDHLDESIMNKFSKFLNKYELMKDNVIKDIKLVLYNNRIME